MKKQIITEQDIQRDLLAVLNKRKVVTVWLTAFLCASTFLYFLYAVLYANGVYLPPRHLGFINTTAVMMIVPFIILFLAGFLFCYYYSNLYEIKKRKFSVIKEKLSQKEREMKRYYRRMEKENALYFRCGRIAVEDSVYSHSNVGEYFYLVKLKSSKELFLAYHTKHYEIKYNL